MVLVQQREKGGEAYWGINMVNGGSAASATLTLLRLTSPFGEGDGRFVHHPYSTFQEER